MGIDWLTIPSGSFIAGSPETEACHAAYSENQVEVVLTCDYRMSRTEITQKQWEALGFPNPSRPKCDDCPVVFVNWFEALAFCNALSNHEGLEECYDLSSCSGEVGSGCPEGDGVCGSEDGAYVCSGNVHKHEEFHLCKGYRLPTTAEWEYAARAGTTTATYNGDLEDDSGWCVVEPVFEPIGWYCANSGAKLHEVGLRQPNGWGLFDMLGNVREWADYVHTGLDLASTEGEEPPLANPSGPLEGDFRDVRGGDFYAIACYSRAAFRPGPPPDIRSDVLGFRVARTLPACAFQTDRDPKQNVDAPNRR